MALNDKKKKDRPSTSQGVGSAARVLTGGGRGLPTDPTSIIGGINAAVGAATAPLRGQVSQAASGFATGFTGNPQRTLTPQQPAPQQPAAVAQPAGGQAPGAVANLPNAPQRPATAQIAPPRPGDPQTFTGSGGTRQLPSFAPAPEQTPQQRVLAQPVVAPDNPTRQLGPRIQGGVIANEPGAASPGVYGGEAQRRLEIALMTTGKGSPSVRRGLIDAYTQQQGANSTAALASQNAGANADLQQQKDAASANEAFAGRRLDASQFNVETALSQQESAAEGQRANRTLTDQSGNTNVLRNDGSLTPLTGADGQPVREQTDTGQVTPAVQYAALADQVKSITENTLIPAEERQAMLLPLQSQMDTLAGKVKQGKPSISDFLEQARTANPNATDEQLTAFYKQKYGQ